MPQFPMTDSRRRTLEKIPDYEVAISTASCEVIVKHGDLVIADSKNALLIQETRHNDVFYIPEEDVTMSLLTPTDLSTYCPFKGHASYWSLSGNNELENFVWSYLEPYPEVEELSGYFSFYTNKVEVSLQR